MAIYSGNNLVATKGGVSNYPDLDNKPQINNVILTGNKTAEDLGLQAAGDYALKSEIPTNTSDLTNDSNFITTTDLNNIYSTNHIWSGDNTYTKLLNRQAILSTDPTVLINLQDTNDKGYAQLTSIYDDSGALHTQLISHNNTANKTSYLDITCDETSTYTIETYGSANYVLNDNSVTRYIDVKDEINKNRTNCITKIPQDIKLELNDGTLTLKAGSVYYKCDGNFTKTTLEQDISVTDIGDGIRFVSVLNNALNLHVISGISSGSIQPSSGTKWFNTTNNIMYNSTDNGANWTELPDFSLPLAIITVENNTITSIDQVFNGFGYMGSIVFTLPGIEGLRPNGRNADGSLKNILFISSEVCLTVNSTVTRDAYFSYGIPGTLQETTIFTSSEEKPNTKSTIWYQPSTNIIQRISADGETISELGLIFGKFKVEEGKVVSLTPKTTFQAVDYNEYSKDIVEIKENVSDKVSLTKNEEIAGTKTFTDDITAPNQVDYTQITNCITKIPQDIKLELNNGVLTLKAGSKIYYPDGTSVIIENDIQNQSISGDATSFIRYQNGMLFTDWDISKFSSGTTVPSDYSDWFFNTTEKTICFYNTGIKEENTNCSLPLGITTVTTNTIISIDQIFNGFGYIGSTVFALPGVEGLVPNGKNEDGSLNNTSYTMPSVAIYTNSVERTNAKLSIGPGGTLNKIIIRNTLTYNSDINFNYNGTTNALELNCGLITADSTGRITAFNPKKDFQALDYNEYEYLVSSVPSSVYQKMKDITNTTVSLVDGISIYKLNNITSTMTVSFTCTALSNLSADRVITFELYVPVANTVPTITWPTGVVWLAEETPTFEANTNYLLAFRSFDQGVNWIGNMQCSWPNA